ncbi:MAG: amino acid ABC transporter permease [Pseudaminobacter sp.]
MGSGVYGSRSRIDSCKWGQKVNLDLSPIVDNWRYLAGGFYYTVLLSFGTIVGSFFVGTALGLLRCYGPKFLVIIVTFYIDSIRAIPVLVIIVWIYFSLPIFADIVLAPFYAALIALIAHFSVYVAEAVRAGIQSVREGQTRAGLALGMSYPQVVRVVILPQAFVRMIPPLGSIVTTSIKDTAIASIIAVPELMRAASTVSVQTYRPMEVLTVAIIAFFLLIFPITVGINAFYRRISFLGRS